MVPVRRLPWLAAVAVAGVLAVTACSDDTTTAGTSAADRSSAGAAEVDGTLTVFAAASLTESFTELGERFEAAHPGVDVTFSFAASSGLARQIVEGAPADVFAAASTSTMGQVAEAGGAAAEPVVFVRNVMEIAVPPGNPAGVASVADLARAGVKVAVCAEDVPCGTVAAKVFENAGLTVTPVTYGADVKAVLTSVTLGEVDAGVVYATDVRAAGEGVEGLTIPAGVNASTSYPIAPLTDAPNPAAAAAFVEFVRSDEAGTVLADAGFQPGP